MEDIINGRMTFQRAFMSGVMQRMKGDFRILRTLENTILFFHLSRSYLFIYPFPQTEMPDPRFSKYGTYMNCRMRQHRKYLSLRRSLR